MHRARFGVACGLAALGLLSGCLREPPPPTPPVIIAPDLTEYVPGESEIYCYSTLADVVCSSQPQGGPPNRLVGAYTNRPAAPPMP